MPLKLVRRSGSPCYYLRGTVRGQSIFESTGCVDERAAEAVRVQREARLLNDSIFGAKATATFLQAAVSYVEAGGSPRFLGTPSTGLAGRFADRKLHTLTQSDLEHAAQELYPRASAETRNRQCYTPFIAVWNHAVGNGWAEVRKWSRPRKPKGTAVRAKKRAGSRAIDYETAGAFVAAMSPAPAMAMAMLFYTGLRPIELFALQAQDIDLAKRWITLRSSKTGEPRGVPLHGWLAEWIGPLIERARVDGKRVFRTPRGEPYPLTENGGGQLKTAIAGAKRRSGIEGVSPYTARHTVSTQLVIAGVHPHIKDQILGHAVDDMSRRYTHVPQVHLIEAIDKIPVPEALAGLPWLADPISWQHRLAKGTGRRSDLERKLA